MATLISIDDLSVTEFGDMLTGAVLNFPTIDKIPEFIHEIYRVIPVDSVDGQETYRSLPVWINWEEKTQYLYTEVQFDALGRIIPTEGEVLILNGGSFKEEIDKRRNEFLNLLDRFQLKFERSNPHMSQEVYHKLHEQMKSNDCALSNSGVNMKALEHTVFKDVVSQSRQQIISRLRDLKVNLAIALAEQNTSLNGIIVKTSQNAFYEFEEEMLNKGYLTYGAHGNKWIGNKADFARLLKALQDYGYLEKSGRHDEWMRARKAFIQRYSCDFKASDDMLKWSKAEDLEVDKTDFGRLSFLNLGRKG